MVINNWIEANLIWITNAIAILVIIYFVFVIIQTIRKKRRFASQLHIILLILGLMFLIFLTYRANEIEGKDWGQIILMLGLVIITALYASSTEKQAKASTKMVEEMKKQTIMSSRPWIIQKAIHEDEKQIRPIEDSFNPNYFSHFEIYNQGGGPAIELEISLRDKLDREGTGLQSHRETFLMAGKTLEFYPADVVSLDESKTYYLACEYQSVLSRSLKIWYQTLLPFEPVKSSKDGKIYVKAGELEFKEVSEEERIDAFRSRSKPK